MNDENTCGYFLSQSYGQNKNSKTHLFRTAGCLLQTSSTSSNCLYRVQGPEINNKINFLKLILLSEMNLDCPRRRTITHVRLAIRILNDQMYALCKFLLSDT